MRKVRNGLQLFDTAFLWPQITQINTEGVLCVKDWEITSLPAARDGTDLYDAKSSCHFDQFRKRLKEWIDIILPTSVPSRGAATLLISLLT